MSLRERLRRMGAAGIAHAPAQGTVRPRATPGDPEGSRGGVEVVRTRFSLAHRHGRLTLGDALEALGGAGGEPLASTVWLDIETTGLAGGTGTYAFLVGLAYLEAESLVVEQLLLRRLSAEVRLLASLGERLGRLRRLVTFNGRRFDWPVLEARFVLSRQRPAALEAHTDLIYPARRLWHRALGTHRLSALEAEVLRAPRQDDVPGWEIPMLYVRYLRSTDRAALDPVVAHNRADLLALVLLHGEVARILRDPGGVGGPLDWEGAGALLARDGAHRRALACFERAAAQADAPHDRWRILRRLARIHRLLGEPERARARWEAEAAAWTCRDRFRARVLEEVAKGRERRGDTAGARCAAEEALAIASALNENGHAAAGAAALSCLADRLRARLARLEQAATH